MKCSYFNCCGASSFCWQVAVHVLGLLCTVNLAYAAASKLHQGSPDYFVEAWVTTGDKSKLLQLERGMFFKVQPVLTRVIDVDPEKKYQELVGFGASLTDASARLMQKNMTPVQRNTLMKELFGPAPGIDLSFARLTIGASDFSTNHYTFDDRPAGETDFALKHFSIDPNRKDVLPLIREALAINPKLKVMASPWSAPAWMKTNDHLYKGSLKPDAYQAFADYFIRYLDAYAQEGVPIFALTIQNEPHFEPGDYPGMRIDSAARAKFVGEYLGPLLAKRSTRTRIIDWDHNWDEPQAPLEVLADPRANKYVDGVGWHCYAGDVSMQGKVHAAHPDKETYFTECSGGQWKPHWKETFPWFVRNLIIGTTRGWAKGVLLWNLALDEKFGPHLGGCKDCRGVVTINSATGEVTRNLEYYALAHASRFVRSGARRIESSTDIDGLDSVAFQNADDASIALIVLNSAAMEREFSIRFDGRAFSYRLPDASAVTFVWNSSHARGRPLVITSADR